MSSIKSESEKSYVRLVGSSSGHYWVPPENGINDGFTYGKNSNSPHNSHMSDISREELDAKLATVEARTDARLERFEKDMRQVVSEFRLEVQPLKNLKANLWSATAVIVATIIAVVSMSFTAFDSGRETSQLVEAAKQQTQQTQKLLEQIQAQQKSIQAAPQAPSTTSSDNQRIDQKPATR